MAQPTPYTPSYSFADWQTAHPSDPLPADSLDIQLSSLSTFSQQVCNNLAVIQRDDGALANGLVTLDSLSSSLAVLMGLDKYVIKGAWLTATAYAVGNVIATTTGTYVCATAHTSGDFATDYAAGKWLLLATTGTSTASAFTATGAAAPTNGMYLPAANTLGLTANSLDVLRLSSSASAVNRFRMLASAAAAPIQLLAEGTDASIDIALVPKGAGRVTAPEMILAAPLAIAQGGTGASTAAAARTALGSGATGDALFLTTTALAARTAIGAQASGSYASSGANSDITSLSGLTTALSLPQDFRLTLTTGVPVTTTDVTGATTVYCAPYRGNQIALWNGTTWQIYNSAEFSLALGTLTSGKAYDVFCYQNAGVPTLELSAAWNSDTTRFASGPYASALPKQNGIYVKSTNGTAIDATRRFLGSFYTTSTTTTEDSLLKRLLSNYYHWCPRPMRRTDSTASWTYTTNTLRQANGSAANQLEFLQCVAEHAVSAQVVATARNTIAGTLLNSGIGVDSTTTNSGITGLYRAPVASYEVITSVKYDGIPGVGRHYLAWLEQSGAAGTTTWNGDQGATISGISGTVMA